MLSPDRLRLRSELFQAIRSYFHGLGYLEVDTPILQPACAPETHIQPLTAGKLYLQTSPELCMKRLLAAGCRKIFQICRCFRGNERGRFHLPEFTMLEWYRSGGDYLRLMTECEELFMHLAEYFGRPPATAEGREISLSRPWERLTVAEAFARHAGTSPEQALAENRFEELLVERIEPHLEPTRPVFLHDFPAQLAALARRRENNPALAERFELYIGGLELANGFSELTDPLEQRRRFLAAGEDIRNQGRDPGPMPEPFLAELDAMPAAAGIALGLDRLAMLFLGEATIDRVVSFIPEEL